MIEAFSESFGLELWNHCKCYLMKWTGFVIVKMKNHATNICCTAQHQRHKKIQTHKHHFSNSIVFIQINFCYFLVDIVVHIKRSIFPLNWTNFNERNAKRYSYFVVHTCCNKNMWHNRYFSSIHMLTFQNYRTVIKNVIQKVKLCIKTYCIV